MENRPDSSTELKIDILNYPDKPGVYLMKNENKKIIYVGKAKSLKKRLLSYFAADRDPKTALLMENVRDVEIILTRNEYEALLLENTLIKQWKPRFNINLKDGKSYPLIRITNEPFPRVFRTRRIIFDGSEYYGPFPSASQIDIYLELIEKLFPLRKCKGRLKRRNHPCLYFHIKRCSAPCAGMISREDYGEIVKSIRKLLTGKPREILEALEKAMAAASADRKYEKAAVLRDKINALREFSEVQKVLSPQTNASDYLGMAISGDEASFTVMQIRNGVLAGKELFACHVYSEKEEAITQFMTQYYARLPILPRAVYLPSGFPPGLLSDFFKDHLGKKIRVISPQKGKHAALVRTAEENAKEDLAIRTDKQRFSAELEDLRQILNMHDLPHRIEGFDISHFGGKYPVASLVSFYNGRPDKSRYRYFRIRTLKEGEIDDFGAVREAVARRYTRVKNENLEKPDLILIDGGKGQVSAANGALKLLKMDNIPLAGLAKEHEEIYTPDNSDPIKLPLSAPGLRLLIKVRDESHRFATRLNKKLREQESKKSLLEKIKGIGPRKSKRLLAYFISIDKIRDASEEEIAAVAGIPKETAREVKKFLSAKA
ncbi:MAG: excinuclease ABC subunit UvrC [Spirochaetales bacterium]|nr:excinuclease ABC subunit UvrC [Spirochaetales bacterium]